MARSNSNKSNKNAKVFIVTSPIPNYNGVGAGGVQFAYGKAEVCEGWVLNWYKSKKGYTVEPKIMSTDEQSQDTDDKK